MNITELIKKIEADKTKIKSDLVSDEGLERLKAVAKEYSGEYSLVWSKDTLEEIKDRPKKESHKSGVPEFDGLTGGFRPQQMVGIGAQSGHGKTAFGLWLLKQYESLNPVLLPLEQSSEELIEQRYENGQFIPNYLSPKKHSAFVNPDWIEQRIVEAIAKHNSKMIMLDHMGYIEAGDDYRREGEHLRIEKKLQAIKHLAIKWNVTIVILIQLSQIEEENAPQLRDLKGSSAIRQECDKIILLWRNNTKSGKARVYDNKVLVSLQKNRFDGQNGNLGAEFEFKTGEYLFTKNSAEWCENLEAKAKEEVTADNAF
jgi:replicative DNA helicase